jgi:chorismate mutase/prephenate dehydratase
MSDSASDLELLRRRIDEIDDRLQNLLIERAEIVASVGAHKRGQGAAPAYQPGREAEIIRRLVHRGKGAFPAATLVRMWRELLAATVRMQSAFTVAVYAPPQMPGYWDLVRDHFGSHTPMIPCRSTSHVIGAVTEGQAAVGVLPMPSDDDSDPWWRHLLSTDDNAPHVIARLPFGARGNARSDVDALAIGRGVEQPTGQDRTLLATENAPDISRARIVSMLSDLGLSCTFMTSSEHADGAHTLIEIDGFIASDDPRLDRFRARLGKALYRMLRLGSYAVPLPPSAFAEAARSEREPARAEAVAAAKG